MIGKAASCAGGTGLGNYLMDEKKGYELMRNNVSGETPKEIHDNMSIIQQQNSRVEKNTFSMVLSPSIKDGKNLNDKQLRAITKNFLKEMDLDPDSRQYVAFVHTEKEHKHIHILMNRVKLDGSLIKDNFIGKKARMAAHRTAEKYNLISARNLKEEREQREKTNNKKVINNIKKANYQVLKEKPKNLEEYTKKMKEHGILVKPTINKQGNIQGFRFIHEATKTNLKASQVDRNLRLHQVFKLDKDEKANSLKPDENIERKSSLNTSILDNVLSLLSYGGGNEEDSKKKKKKKGITSNRTKR